MPTSPHQLLHRQQDRDRREASRRPDEPRNLVAPAHESTTRQGAYAGFDANLNPIDDEAINTHGSER